MNRDRQPDAFSWVPTISMLLVSLISYVDRNTLALLAPTILRDTHLTAEQYGWIISSFSVCYMIGNPVWGRLLDRYGVRVGMLVAVGIWTFASASHAAAYGFWTFAIARAVLGFGEGATFPGSLRTVVQTLPNRWRSRGLAIAYSGGSLGAMVTPVLITPLALRFGWPAAFLFTGLVGAIWLACWWQISRRPELQEQRLESDTDWRWMDRRLWAFMCAYALGGIPLGFVIYGAPLYLSRGLSVSQESLGRILWVPPLGWECGYFFWGWIADTYARTHHRLRRWLLVLAILSLGLAAATAVESITTVLAILFFAMFVAAGFVILSLAYATRIFGTRQSGLIAGLGAGSWSATVAVVMPYFGRRFDDFQYGVAFFYAAVLPLVGCILFLLLSRERDPMPAQDIDHTA